MEENIISVLRGIIHPAEGRDIVSLGMVENARAAGDEAIVILQLKKVKDPFAKKIKKAVEDSVAAALPQYAGKVTVVVKEMQPKEIKQPNIGDVNKIGRIVAVSSCKGGVGKSTVTANIARTFADKGYKVGIIDADIYGPSMPKIFGLEGYVPGMTDIDGRELLIPAVADGIKIMSIGFFIKPTDALAWRGPMATNALKQLMHQTLWGDVDFLFLDMPPGTGDVHLTVLSELKVDGAVIVSTPQSLAIADVVRGLEMFGKENVNIPVFGLVENMSWFSPADAPDKKYYIFGKDGCKRLAEERGLPLLAQVPVIMRSDEFDEKDALNLEDNPVLKAVYGKVADSIIEKLK